MIDRSQVYKLLSMLYLSSFAYANDEQLPSNDVQLCENDGQLPSNDVELCANDVQPPPVEETCRPGYKHQRLTLRHIEGKGIGYNDGYTTLEAFFAPNKARPIVPFVDLRGHVFDNGKYAANAGLGARWRWGCNAYGINGYYDYRNDKKGFNQASVGLEFLGTRWESRINGYLPFGKKISAPYQPQFSHFKGHTLFLSQKFEFAMKGFDAEIGRNFDWRNVNCYAGLGPYYYDREIGSPLWGGKARLSIAWKDYVGFQLSGSGDKVFHGIVQGELFLRLPLGPKPVIKKRPKCGSDCQNGRLLDRRMTQPVVRDEIIVLDKGRRTSAAINPATGSPYVWWFVNNLSHSNGTFQSPFSTLAAAQNASGPNDIIYVFPGNNLGTGMSSGIVLQNAQQLLGATIDHTIATTIGTISIPPQASGNFLPLLTNSGDVVTLNNNNVVSGFFIVPTTASRAVFGNGVNNTEISRNYMQSITNGITIELDNATGQIMLTNNVMLGTFTGKNLFIDNTLPIANTTYLIQNNLMKLNNGNNIFIVSLDGSNNTFQFIDNQIVDAPITVINEDTSLHSANTFSFINNQIAADSFLFEFTLEGTGGTTNNFNLLNNSISGEGSTFNVTQSAIFNATIEGNQFTNSDNGTMLLFESFLSSTLNAVISDNNFLCGQLGINVQSNTSSNSSISISGNVFQSQNAQGILIENTNTNTLSSLINNNTFLNFATNGVEILNTSTGIICSELYNNNSNLFPNSYLIDNTAGGAIHLQQFGNQGQLIETGNGITNTPCP